MNKIVREHYPVEKLPKDLRPHDTSIETVTVEIISEHDKASSGPLSADDAVTLMRQMQHDASAAGRSATAEGAVRRIRALRDEWDL